MHNFITGTLHHLYNYTAHYTSLHSTPHCSTKYVSHGTTLLCTVPHHTKHHIITLRTTLHYDTLYHPTQILYHPTHTAAHYPTPRHTTPQHSTPHDATPLNTTRRHTAPRYTTPHNTLHYTTPHHTSLHHTTPHYSPHPTKCYCIAHYTIRGAPPPPPGERWSAERWMACQRPCPSCIPSSLYVGPETCVRRWLFPPRHGCVSLRGTSYVLLPASR